jgi:hypothetical protein
MSRSDYRHACIDIDKESIFQIALLVVKISVQDKG